MSARRRSSWNSASSPSPAPCRTRCNTNLLPRLGSDEDAWHFRRRVFEPAWQRQVLRLEEGGVEQPALIAGAVVAQHRHDGVARPKIAREPDRPGDVDAARSAQ